jgi:carboxyl-terminal processing protease
MMDKFSREEVLGVYLDTLAHVYDPHSDYLGHEEMDSLSIAMNLFLSGIGATLQSEDGYCRIRSLVPGGPAAKSRRLKPDDRIVAVAQQGQAPVDIIDMPPSQAVELIRGPKGSAVTLTIIPADAPDDSIRQTVTLVRDAIRLEDQRAKARVIDLPVAPDQTLRLGVVDLPSFYGELSPKDSNDSASATKDVALLLRKLQELDVKGVILDLRQNGGGSLPEAIKLTGLFIRKGPIVQTRDAKGRIEVDDDPDSSVAYEGPLIVLTSRFTASASEILAGALQDYQRAIIVGDSSTFGKGTVQSVIPLKQLMDRNGLAHGYDPGALKVTISKFYRPDGASTQLKGVQSDIILPSLTDDPKFAESAMKNPLPWDQVPPAFHTELDRTRPYLRALSERSASRVAGDEVFACLKQEIAELGKRQAATVVSLNEAIRQKEKQRSEADQKAWEAKLAAIPRPFVKEYEITVQNAEQPGLTPSAPKPDSPAQPSPGKGADSSRQSNPAGLLGDPILRESEHILADYVELTSRDTTFNQASAKAPAGWPHPAPVLSRAALN